MFFSDKYMRQRRLDGFTPPSNPAVPCQREENPVSGGDEPVEAGFFCSRNSPNSLLHKKGTFFILVKNT